jgi:hypothetical protein
MSGQTTTTTRVTGRVYTASAGAARRPASLALATGASPGLEKLRMVGVVGVGY